MRLDSTIRPTSSRWREDHPEAHELLTSAIRRVGRAVVLMMLSISLIGTVYTLQYLELPDWAHRSLMLVCSASAFAAATTALWCTGQAAVRALRSGHMVRTSRRDAAAR